MLHVIVEVLNLSQSDVYLLRRETAPGVKIQGRQGGSPLPAPLVYKLQRCSILCTPRDQRATLPTMQLAGGLFPTSQSRGLGNPSFG